MLQMHDGRAYSGFFLLTMAPCPCRAQVIKFLQQALSKRYHYHDRHKRMQPFQRSMDQHSSIAAGDLSC